MKVTKIIKADRGYVVALALIAMMAMSFFLMTGAMTTSNTIKVSGNYVRTVDTFNLAEVGLAKARPLLENVSFDSVLTNYSGSYLIAPTAFNSGTYEVKVSNDENDTAGSTTNDTNSIIKVTSIGRATNGGKVTIATYVQLVGGGNVTFPPNPTSCAAASCDSAALVCGSTANVSGGGFEGGDHPTPTYGCNGSGCNVTEISGTTSNWDLIGQGALTGASGSVTVYQNAGTAANCNQWQTFYNQWSAVSQSAPGVVYLTGSSYSGASNPCTSPKVYVINSASATYSITGNTYLCGMFIIASNTSVSISGTITLSGVVLMMGPYSNITYAGSGGTSQIVGKVIFRSDTSDVAAELSTSGNSSIEYSSAGVTAALTALNNANAGGGVTGTGMLLTSAWDETY